HRAINLPRHYAGRGSAPGARFRHPAFPSRLFAFSDVPRHVASDANHAAWSARPRRPAGSAPDVSRHATGVDFRRSTPTDASGPMGGNGLSWASEGPAHT